MKHPLPVTSVTRSLFSLFAFTLINGSFFLIYIDVAVAIMMVGVVTVVTQFMIDAVSGLAGALFPELQPGHIQVME